MQVRFIDDMGQSYGRVTVAFRDKSAGDQFLQLDEVQIFPGGTANANFETFGADGVLQHDGSLT